MLDTHALRERIRLNLLRSAPATVTRQTARAIGADVQDITDSLRLRIELTKGNDTLQIRLAALLTNMSIVVDAENNEPPAIIATRDLRRLRERRTTKRMPAWLRLRQWVMRRGLLCQRPRDPVHDVY